MQSTTDDKKAKQNIWTKKSFITCSKLLINELARSLTRSKNAYLANNDQASISVFTAVFCFKHTQHNLIKPKLYNKWSAHTVYYVLGEIQRKQSNLLNLKN